MPDAQRANPSWWGRYRLGREIGLGSIGAVYRAFDRVLERTVALKVIRRDRADEAEAFAAHLRNEARTAGQLAHPGIVAIHEHGALGACGVEQDYLAMEFVDGQSLRTDLERGVVFSVPQIIALVSQLLDALQHAHERGVWHCDIKPGNLLMTRAGRLKITDFGIACRDCPKDADAQEILGTPGFVAPETYLGNPVDGRIDVFAAGAVLYRLLAGIPAYAGTAASIMVQVCCETPVPPSLAGAQPRLRDFDPVVLKALARRPEDRFATAAEFRDALLHASSNRP